jgi:transposase
MSYLAGEDRDQVQLLPPSVDEYVAEDAPVRAIEAFVRGLDLRQLELASEPAATGRPAYNPADLLMLYLYGYLHRIRSSRRLEAECHRNLELIWLLRGLRPDHWTIAAFRREHRTRFKAVFREFNLLCRKLELFGAELVAIDGAKFKAVNNPRRHYSAGQLRELVAQVDARIGEYLEQLDRADDEQAGSPARPGVEAMQEKLAQLLDRATVYQHLQDTLAATQQNEIALTDPDSRGQKKVRVGYNVQVAVDAEHDLIVASDVVQDQNDLAQLHPMAKAAQAELQSPALNAVADAGYHHADQLEKCEQAKVTTYVPAPAGTAGRSNTGAEVYPKTEFAYESTTDTYRCPAGHTLPFTGEGDCRGTHRRYYYNKTACAGCALKSQCTSAKYRRLSRVVNEAVVERQALRVAAEPQIVRERKTIVEHVFGTLRWWGHDTFLCQGLEMVRAEFTLSALAYNLRRALNLKGAAQILQVLRGAPV